MYEKRTASIQFLILRFMVWKMRYIETFNVMWFWISHSSVSEVLLHSISGYLIKRSIQHRVLLENY